MVDRKPVLTKGRYSVRFAQDPGEIALAQALRTLCFSTQGLDCDRFDADCQHLLVSDNRTGTLVCCCRLLLLENGGELGRSYSAQYYDLGQLHGYAARIAELGRFCTHPDWQDPDILRLAWGGLTGFVDDNGVDLLIGCTSFRGTDPTPYLDSFALLGARHAAPVQWIPRIKAPEVIAFSTVAERTPDTAGALLAIPPLLRSYLLMGGWVSDHAVVDRSMNTLHVFTGLEIDAIPDTRKRLLRAFAG
ncbi:GNAT family N-acetyltransferase [Sedimentitalea nanhaiensis]|uniref:L-ornithine N(alpha)-acyltransferase n=1 Tax=Sedimentitalea nanhaiensis TaxID=999627 RepID=A0A1I7AMT1_9RHOB|nr:GNAT family N-acyltransferase [Sedimentitalea nanhaiensis]SFT76153.1 ornithine-acyl[acyl carrier protein] N-acyltransferase [Sedimentitalea nanhaiensis]